MWWRRWRDGGAAFELGSKTPVSEALGIQFLACFSTSSARPPGAALSGTRAENGPPGGRQRLCFHHFWSSSRLWMRDRAGCHRRLSGDWSLIHGYLCGEGDCLRQSAAGKVGLMLESPEWVAEVTANPQDMTSVLAEW